MAAIALTFSDEDTAARTVVGEASNQGDAGMAAVAWVIRNRAQWHPAAWWGDNVQVVCLKHEQFSCWIASTPEKPNKDYDRIKAIATTDNEYRAAIAAVRKVMAGEIEDPTAGATTYKVRGTKASWDHAVADFLPIPIGAHDFWILTPDGKCLSVPKVAEAVNA